MIKDLYINEIFKEIVEGLTPTTYFRFGYWPEINTMLNDMAQDKTYEMQRYPFIMLSAGWTESKEQEQGIYCEASNIVLYIVAQSDKNYSTEQRESLVFQPVIMPIYNAFLNAIKANEHILTEYGDFPHEITKLYYLKNLSEKQNQLRNYVEVLQINPDKVTILESYTCQ